MASTWTTIKYFFTLGDHLCGVSLYSSSFLEDGYWLLMVRVKTERLKSGLDKKTILKGW